MMDKIPNIQAVHFLQDGVKLKYEATRQKVLPQNSSNNQLQEDLSYERIKNAVDKINAHLLGKNAHFEVSMHEKTKRIMVKLINSENQQVIKELPPEEALDRIANIWEMTGLVIDKKE